MVEFRLPAAADTRGGGPTPASIPMQLVGYLDRTYETGTVCEIPIGDSDQDAVEEVLRLARIHARRKDKSLKYQIDEQAGLLRLHMRDKRPYTWHTPRSESA